VDAAVCTSWFLFSPFFLWPNPTLTQSTHLWMDPILACIGDSGLYAVFGDDPPECSVMILVHNVSGAAECARFHPPLILIMCTSVWLCVNVYSRWGIIAVASLSLGRARGGRMRGCFTFSTPNCNFYFLILQYHRCLSRSACILLLPVFLLLHISLWQALLN